ncbi:hypothetical protein M422DRAFT_247020 [Sphaerobolus stellatus SS14]|nr:hypothetical protein M422DRAFT_247020 [Sphaerobolus stellatus SS14]
MSLDLEDEADGCHPDRWQYEIETTYSSYRCTNAEADAYKILSNFPTYSNCEIIWSLILEYVDGFPLKTLHVGENMSKKDAEEVSQEFLNFFRAINRQGVIHADVCRDNMMLRRDNRQPIIIDFAVVLFREDASTKE